MKRTIGTALAVLAIGLGGLTLASPAHASRTATCDKAETLAAVEGAKCFRLATVTVKQHPHCKGLAVTIDPGTVGRHWRITSTAGFSWGGQQDGYVSGDSKTVDVPAAQAVGVKVELWLGSWTVAKFEGPADWKDPGYCKPPVVTASTPTCDVPGMTVTVENSNTKIWLWVSFDDGKGAWVKAGEKLPFGPVTEPVTVHVKGFKDQVITYTKPVCTTPEPTPTATATPTATPMPTETPTAPGGGIPTDDGTGSDGGDSLPVTGAKVGGLVVGALAAIGIGIGLLVGVRRRRDLRFVAE